MSELKRGKAISGIIAIHGFALMLLFLVGCAGGLGSSPSSAELTPLAAVEEVKMSQLDVNRYPVNKLVCDPIDGSEPDPRSNVGLKAELFYLPKGSAVASRVNDVISHGQKAASDIFFSQINVPTRLFDQGFLTDLGEPIKTDTGEKLIENFALRFKSVLRLAPEQEPGLYEFAVLSDDGAVLKMRDAEGVWSVNVDNDGVHPTRLGCASTYEQFDRNTERLIELSYHQGPRYHIALTVLMRKISSDGKRDPACGLTGNSTWFDANNASSPKKAYTDLLTRGWKPLTKDNYTLANDAIFNPCKDGVTPKITNLTASETTADGIFVVWRTDIPATSQVVATEWKTGLQTITQADNVLRQDHSVWVRGLKRNTEYGLQAVSISDTYGKGMTTPIRAFTSP